VVGVLLEAKRRLDALDGRLVLVSDDPRIRRVFELTGLDRHFVIERSLMETIGDLSNGTAQ
jgi:anti-anti-sigma factor